MISYKERIAFLPQELYEFAVDDEDIKLDILEQDLDSEEILDLVTLTYQVALQSKPKKKITMTVGESTLQGIKLKAAQEGIPYQTLINMVLHKYMTGKLHE